MAATADVSITKSASSPRTVGQLFTYTISVHNNGPATATSLIMTDNYPSSVTASSASPECNFQGGNQLRCVLSSLAPGATKNLVLRVAPNSNGTLTNSANVISLPADPNASNNSTTINSAVPGLQASSTEETTIPLTYRTSLGVSRKDGRAQGNIIVNESSSHVIDNSGPQQEQMTGRPGTNRIDAYVVESGSDLHGSWRFEFGGSASFVRGSLRVTSGEVVSLDGETVIFAVGSGKSPLRFTFELR